MTNFSQCGPNTQYVALLWNCIQNCHEVIIAYWFQTIKLDTVLFRVMCWVNFNLFTEKSVPHWPICLWAVCHLSTEWKLVDEKSATRCCKNIKAVYQVIWQSSQYQWLVCHNLVTYIELHNTFVPMKLAQNQLRNMITPMKLTWNFKVSTDLSCVSKS